MENRTTILLCALKLFASRGYDAVGVQEIANKARITKPTLYYYYGSKSGLLEAILKEYGDQLETMISEASVYHGDLSLALTKLVTVFFQFAKENSMFYRMQLAMYFAAPESQPNQMVRHVNQAQLELIEELFIQAANHHGSLRGRHLTFAATFIGTINTYIGFALNGYIELNEDLAGKAVHQFMYGIYA
jgi:TetR/AcrR family transcriptional regulator